jgi:hypothetical protein
MVVAVALISVAEGTMSVAVYRLHPDVGRSQHVSGGLLGECFELALQFAERGLWSDLTLDGAVRGVLHGQRRVAS